MRSSSLSLLLTLGITCAASTAAQTPNRSSVLQDKAQARAVKITTRTLDFHPVTLVANLKASPALTLPFQCGPAGLTLVNMVDVTEAGNDRFSLYEISRDSATRIAVSSVSDLEVQSVRGPFPSGTGEIVTIYGRRKLASGAEKPPMRNYVAFFGNAGQYERSIELKTDEIVWRTAMLPSGNLLVSGMNLAARQSTLAVYSDTGDLIRPLDQPMTASERPSSGPPSTVGTIFLNHGADVIAYRPGTKNAILEIGPKDTVKEIRLALPPDAMISEMVASDDTLIVRSYPEHDATQAVDTRTGVYYEFDALDGSLLRKLESGNTLVSNIACKADGQFNAFVTNQEHQFMRFVAPE